MQLMFELHLLAHSFKKDADDPERIGIHLDNICFYYNKYYKKPLTTRYYGVETWDQLVALIPDVIFVTKQSTIESLLEEEMESLGVFVKLAEEARRYRLLQIDLGEESAKLKLQQAGTFNPHNQGPRQQTGYKGAAGGKPGQQPWYGGGGCKGFPPQGGKDGKGKGKVGAGMKGDNRFQPYGAKGGAVGVAPPPPMQQAPMKGGFKGGFKG
mmetsp:Transcript_97379/g.251942  ORF Transcript_97379/g.251942 Transcript_97379/m.251942 type:complete len:211 (+) Transcript_97379:1-633(+)